MERENPSGSLRKKKATEINGKKNFFRSLRKKKATEINGKRNSFKES